MKTRADVELPASPEAFRTIWLSPDDDGVVQIIDQRVLPHTLQVLELVDWRDGRFMAIRFYFTP